MRILMILCIFFTFGSTIFAQNIQAPQNPQNTNNPGYFLTPGFIAFGGNQVYNGSGVTRDKDIRPFFMGMINLAQSEYLNIGLSLSAFFTTPGKYYNNNSTLYRITAHQYTTELGLNFYTASKTINYLAGIGYNLSYVEGHMRNVKNATGASSSYSRYMYDTVPGWNYYIGFEYLLTKDAKWGLFVMFRGQESRNASFENNTRLQFNDGSSAHLNTASRMNINNKTYMLGLMYHF